MADFGAHGLASASRPLGEAPWLAGYLGYRWNPTRDGAAWRRQRIEQARQALA
jgi:hypothetical protein